MKKVVMVFFAFLFLIVGVSVFISARHSTSEFYINVDGINVNLQRFIDDALIFSGNSFSSPSDISNPGHSFGDIVVATSTRPSGVDFLTALSSGEKIIGSEGLEPDTSSLAFGHSSVSIFIDSLDKSLQKMINDGDLCVADICLDHPGNYGTDISDGCGGMIDCSSLAPSYTYSWETGVWSSNGACPTTTFTRSVLCERNDGEIVDDIYCSGTKPASSTTTTCTWHGGSNTCSGMFSSLDYEQCSSVLGTSCNSAGNTGYCTTGGTCDCGWMCSAPEVRSVTCTINSP